MTARGAMTALELTRIHDVLTQPGTKKTCFLTVIIFDFVNKISASADETPGILVISRIMKIPEVWSARSEISFTELKITRMEPTGAGGASGDSHQRRHQTNRQGGGAAVAI